MQSDIALFFCSQLLNFSLKKPFFLIFPEDFAQKPVDKSIEVLPADFP